MSENGNQKLTYTVTADASGVPVSMKQAAAGFERSAEEMQASAEKVSAAVEKFSTGTKKNINSVATSLKSQKFDIPEMRQVLDKLKELNRVTGQLNRTNRQTFDESSASAKRYAAAVTQAAAQIAASEKLLNGRPLTQSQVSRLAAMRAQQGPDRNTGSFQAGNAATSSDFLAQAPQSVRSAYTEQQRTLNAADVTAAESTKKATAANQGYAESERNVRREIGSTISTRLKEDAAIRALQGDLLGVRAAGTFLSMIPGLGAAVASTFELIGAAAVIGIGVELVGKIKAAIDVFRQMPTAIRNAFDTLTQEQAKSNDSIEQTNDSLQQQISRIEHKPQNNLKDALDADKRSADELADSLSNAANKLTDLITKNKVGFFKGLVTGSDVTTPVDDKAQAYADQTATRGSQLDDARAQLALETSKGKGGDKGTVSKFQGIISGIQSQQTAADEKFQKELAVEIAKRSSKAKAYQIIVPGEARGTTKTEMTDYAGRYGDQSRVLAKLRGYENFADLSLESDSDRSQTPALKTRLQHDQAGKQSASDASQADRKKLEGYETQLSDLQSSGNVGANDVYTFWQSKTAAFKRGSEEYLAVVRHSNEAYRQVQAENNEALKSASIPGGIQPDIKGYFGQQQTATQSPVTPTDATKSDDTARFMREDAQAAREYIGTLAEMPALSEKQALAMREANVQIAISTGTISRSGAASAEAAIHLDAYTEAAQRLKDARASIDANTAGLSSNQQAAARATNTQQESDLSANFAVQSIQDKTNLDETKLTTAWKDSLNRFVQMSQDTAGQIGGIFSDSLGGVNNTLATSLTAYYRTGRQREMALRNGLSGDVRNSAQKLAKTGIGEIEAPGLKALGIGGKADGSQKAPFWVKIAGALGLGSGSNSVGATGSSPASHGIGSTVSRALGHTGWFGKMLGFGSSMAPMLNTGGADPLGLGGPPDTSGVANALGANTVDLSQFQGFFASGGSVTGNVPAVVGENGPELFVPHTTGSIVPNGQWGGGGDTHIHVGGVDARGATDPAAVHAAVQRGIREAAPHLVAASLGAGVDRNKRLPSSKRM
jgi:hypothetical protein